MNRQKWQAAFIAANGKIRTVRHTYGQGWSAAEASGHFMCKVRDAMDQHGAIEVRIDSHRRYTPSELLTGGLRYVRHPTLRTLVHEKA